MTQTAVSEQLNAMGLIRQKADASFISRIERFGCKRSLYDAVNAALDALESVAAA